MANHSCTLGYSTFEEQGFRVYKKRMVYYASFDSEYTVQDYDKPLCLTTYKTATEMPESLHNALPNQEVLMKLIEE